MCFVWISEQTAITSLYNINWLVFITETKSVYRTIRTGSLNIIQVNFANYGPCQMDGRRLLISVARVQTQASQLVYNVALDSLHFEYCGFPLSLLF